MCEVKGTRTAGRKKGAKVELVTSSTASCPSCNTITDFLYDFRGEWVCNDCYHRRTVEHYASLGVNLVALRRRLRMGDEVVEEEVVEGEVRRR